MDVVLLWHAGREGGDARRGAQLRHVVAGPDLVDGGRLFSSLRVDDEARLVLERFDLEVAEREEIAERRALLRVVPGVAVDLATARSLESLTLFGSACRAPRPRLPAPAAAASPRAFLATD